MVQDEETGAWYQHRGRDFKVPVADYLLDDGNLVAAKRSFRVWPGFRSYYILLWFTQFIYVNLSIHCMHKLFSIVITPLLDLKP